MNKNDFYSKYEMLSENSHKNYYELESLIKTQLKEEGLQFFEDANLIYLLAKYESTLVEFCQLCEKNITNINQGMLLYLLFSYLHVGDRKNAKRISQLLKESGIEKHFPNFLNGLDDFLPSDNIFTGKYITAQYDKRIEELGSLLIRDLERVEQFIRKQWEDYLPSKIFVYLINGIGPSPYNTLLCGIYFKVGHYQPSQFVVDSFSSGLVHEITHIVMKRFITFPIQQEEFSFFKFIDEGYAEWKRTEYSNNHLEHKIFTNHFATHFFRNKLFTLEEISENWAIIMVNSNNFPMYDVATSFTYFLENKYGYDKVNTFWKMIPSFPSEKRMSEYFTNYYGTALIELMREWKDDILEKKGDKNSISETIITSLKVLHKDENEIILKYKSKYPLWAGHNICIYDDKMKLQSLENMEPYRYINEGRLKMKFSRTKCFLIWVHFSNYSQKIELNAKEKSDIWFEAEDSSDIITDFDEALS